jgi:DUF1365 family protein
VSAVKDGPHRLYRTTVVHRRYGPYAHRLRFAGFRLLLDLDRLDELPALGVAYNRPGWLSFYDRDHGGRDGGPLRAWLVRELARRGLPCPAEWSVHLLAYPRVLGYGFNPLAVWYVRDPDGHARAVLAEVRNTFGEHHSYLLHEGGAPLGWPVVAERPKRFHVSPFLPLEGSYAFRLSAPGASLTVGVRHLDAARRPSLVAVEHGVRLPYARGPLFRQAFAPPFLAHRMMVRIHGRALRLYLRGARFYRKPPPPDEEWTA